MKRKFLLLVLVATVGVSTSTFAQQRPPMPQQHQQKIEHRNTTTAVEVRYYYIPEYNAYFDAVKKIYYYQKNNQWRYTSKPTRINKNIAKAPRQPINDLKKNEMPYTYNAQHQQTWKGQPSGGRR
ncbi:MULTISPECIES: hypothetical protein [Chitinophagaceae]